MYTSNKDNNVALSSLLEETGDSFSEYWKATRAVETKFQYQNAGINEILKNLSVREIQTT